MIEASFFSRSARAGCSSISMTWEAWTIVTFAGRSPAMAANAGLVTDEDDPILRMGACVIERARDDLGRAVIAAHRVYGEPDPARLRSRCDGSAGQRIRTAGSSLAVLISRTGRPP